MNEGLFSAYTQLPEWKQLLERLRSEGCTALYEIAEGERPFAAAAISHLTGRQVVLIAPTELIAQKHAQDIERLTDMSCAVLPPRDIQFSRAAMSRESTWQRLQVLDTLCSHKARVLCLSIDSLLDRCVPRIVFENAKITVEEGNIYAPDKLMADLIRNGYERVPMVEGRGHCAMRGAILDVFPANMGDAIRIEFFDNEVDSIRRFDCISQRSISRTKSIQIAPATECLITDPNAASIRLRKAIEAGIGESITVDTPTAKPVIAADGAELPSLDAFLSGLDSMEITEDLLAGNTTATEAKKVLEENTSYKRHLDDVQNVAEGHTIRTAPMWMNVLCEKTVPITEYLNNPVILCDRPDQFASRLRGKGNDFAEAFEDARMRGDAFDAQKELRFTYQDMLTDWQSKAVVAMTDMQTTLGQLMPSAIISFGSRPSMPYQSQIEPLVTDILKWKEQGCAIVLLTGGEARGRRLQKTLAEHKIPSSYADTLDGNLILREVILLPVTYTKGFLHPAANLCIVSDTDIFGAAYQRAKKKQKAGERIASFTDLKTGDYIVHDLHGVGIYKGVVQMDNDNIKRDYLLIQYAGNDKLYVPADQFDRVQKFIGAEHAAPKLNRLGGSEWEKQKTRVKAGLKELAFSLAELYAKRAKNTGYAFSKDNPWQQEFDDMFPYELTTDQQQCVEQIQEDMESSRNMDRLLCGDVGYGKTEVALRAAFKAMVEGKQVALLAPTTILVQQHFNTIKKRFAGFPVTFDMLSRFRTPKQQKETIQKLKAGEVDLIVGTHRLLNKAVEYKDLGLLIIDEEHRFGVSHKESIKQMKTRVDVLTLSATPIPRTLHMSMVGIRDMSVLETPPEERLPVKTYVMEYEDAIIREAIKRELTRGGQVFFLYNRVRSIEQMKSRIQALVPEARIGIAHGQMRENALEDIMLDFYAGAYDVLLCTTIVENGLDVPDANTLIVFDADRFGLSQLYQIRGRVGRSNRQAYAYFTIRGNKALSETAQRRLSAIREFTEFGAGYRIAMRDLEIRGAGDVLGPQQSGHLSTVGYDMYVKLIEQAVEEVQGIEQTPELDTRVELQIDAYLPADYVPQELLRIEVYKRIAMIDCEAKRLDIEEELIDRFGDIPEPVLNLMHIAQLRGVTRKLGVSRLYLKPDGLHLRLDEKFIPDPALLYEAINNTGNKIRFSVGKTPELVLMKPRITPEEVLSNGIPALTAVYLEVKRLRKSLKDSAKE